MQFSTDAVGTDIAVIRGEGRLNMVSAPALKEAVRDAIDTQRVRVVVDLSRVEFMDSSGLGALVGALKNAREAGGDLRIVAPSRQVAMVLHLSNLDRILVEHASVEEAFSE